MKIARYIVLTLITLLSVTAGIAKIIQVPDEVAFFQAVGFSGNVVIAFGALQFLAGVLLFIPRLQTVGAALAALMFLASAVMIFAAGKLGFAAFALLPFAMAAFIVIDHLRRRSRRQDTGL